MIEIGLDAGIQNVIGMVRWLGETHLRPLGLECDRNNKALPNDHPFFQEALNFLPGGTSGLADEAAARRSDPTKPSFGARKAVLFAEEGAYWDRGMLTSLPGPGLGGPPVAMMGTPEQKKRFLGIFKEMDKPLWGAFAMTEPGAGSDVARIRTRARKDGSHWILTGEKCFISNGGRASWIVVFATVDPALGRSGHRAFVVERGTPGFKVATVEKKLGLAASETVSLVFEECRIPADQLLGGEAYYEGKDEGFKGAMRTFDFTRPMVAAMAVGMARAAYDSARGHFDKCHRGRPGRTAARLAEKLALIRRRIEIGRLMAWKAAWMADMRMANTVEASASKAYGPQVAHEAVSLALEVLGEAGVRQDHLVQKLYRDIKALDIVEGTGQIQRYAMARQLVNFPSYAES